MLKLFLALIAIIFSLFIILQYGADSTPRKVVHQSIPKNKGVAVSGDNRGIINNTTIEELSSRQIEKLLQKAEERKIEEALLPKLDGYESNLVEKLGPQCIFQFQKGKKAVIFGNNAFFLSPNHEGITPFVIGNEGLMSVRQEGDLIFLSVNFYGKDNLKIAAIVDNKLVSFTKDPFYRVVRQDPHRMVIFDREKRKVLDFNYINEQTVEIEGLFTTASGRSLRVTKEGTKLDQQEIGVDHSCVEGGRLFTFRNSKIIFGN